jgi:hypothetical protein
MCIRITVSEEGSTIEVEFPCSGKYSSVCHYSYPLDAVPVQPFRNEGRVKAWEEFMDAMQIPPPITVHGKIPCRWRTIAASFEILGAGNAD